MLWRIVVTGSLLLPVLCGCEDTPLITPPKKTTSGSTAAAPVATGPTTAAAAPVPEPVLPPVTLGFDGEPDAAVKMSETLSSVGSGGRLSVGVPPGWVGEVQRWTDVHTVTKKDGTAGVVLITLGVSDALLEDNLQSWAKVPLATDEITWAPRAPGKVGRLEGQVGTGTGLMNGEAADFWHATLVRGGNSHALVLIAGAKRRAEAPTHAELTAVMRSVTWR